ncbi:MAG: sigma-70 family RNA polymerase sigma factor [Planctomycetaceae bacterium]
MSQERLPEWPQEIEELYRNQGRELWALFYAQCGDADYAYDALQESFTRLQEQNGEPIQNQRAWLLRVGRNWLMDIARRKKIAARPTEHLDHLVGQEHSPETDLAHEELHAQVRAALSEMKEGDRQVLVLRYSLNWSSQRIAEVLETTASAVDMRLSRARKRLGELLEKAGIRQKS